MMDVVCNYAVARFLPYRESGEFVNVEVVLACPQRGSVLYRPVPERLRDDSLPGMHGCPASVPGLRILSL